MTPIQVIGIGLDGPDGLSPSLLTLIDQAAILAGGDRHLSYFPDHPGRRWSLSGLEARLQKHLVLPHPELVVVLTSGDPLFFGLGRQLLQSLPPETITFHPHVSSVQLAFSRVKLPWQDATIVSAHGRSLDQLEHALKMGCTPIAILTDPVNTPAAIAQFILSLGLPVTYQLWVCENLGSADERIRVLSMAAAQEVSAAPLNVVILQPIETAPDLTNLPVLGIPDRAFVSFRDRPGLMTKREIRVQILAALALQPRQVIWDIGAGTGSVSIEAARLVPDAQVWAMEKTTAGCRLIRQNVSRFGLKNVNVYQGKAPIGLEHLPDPHRVFIGGSSGQLAAILDRCGDRLLPQGNLVVALATLENLTIVAQWLQHRPHWQAHYQQISLSRSAAVGPLTRWAPLNPVTLACLSSPPSNE